MAKLYRRHYFAGNCSLHRHGVDVGELGKGQRWINPGDGFNQFLDNAVSLWPTREPIVKCKRHARTLANHAAFGFNLCGITIGCRLFIEKVDNKTQRHEVV